MADKVILEIDRWANLMYNRGIAGSGARKTESDKAIVERSQMREFAEAINILNKVSIKSISQERPPSPDFTCSVNGKTIKVELTEFIDPNMVKESKHIRASPKHPLYKEELTFDTSEKWFTNLLGKAISKKDQIYNKKKINVDILIIWNEALSLGIEDTDNWLQNFVIPKLRNIDAIYFQSWYHPYYLGRPIWSLVEHHQIGSVAPVRKPFTP